ncbi:CLUMA_CG014537, isoform A [Clunio marinus]|uniref:CLUMA_CG014537, isoform A n=1 Tax=Clunio marinus TaxID=568069 RepID=A0A1J1INB3_9DIPT|nr:CLUMA_CG014537, isoform A [Clunio marinus]
MLERNICSVDESVGVKLQSIIKDVEIESEVNDNCYEMVINELLEDQKDYHSEILKRLLENKLAENSPIEEKQEIVEKTYEKNPSLSPSKPDELPLQKVVPMNYIYKPPRIDWWQNDVVVYLLISAVDCGNYSLMVDDLSFQITIRYKGNLIESTAFKLFAAIDSKLTSHELAGLNVTVRLVKRKLRLNWPRLTDSLEKSKFIKFNKEKFDYEEQKQLEYLKKLSRFKGNFTDNFDYEDFSDDEDEFEISDNEDMFL